MTDPTVPPTVPRLGSSPDPARGAHSASGSGSHSLSASHPLSLEDGARVAGHHVWLEMRLFEVLGAWVPTVPEPAVKTHLATHSRRHAWHADLWREHVPRVAGIDADSLVAPPGDGFPDVIAALAEPSSTLDRLAGAYRVVLPRVVTATARRLATATPVAEAALARSLRFVLADDLDEWRDGEALLQSLIAGPEDVDRVSARAAHLEKLLVTAGGL
jgi:hypothetical protein